MSELVYAQRAVLGAVLLTRGELLDQITLTGDDFGAPNLSSMFDAMRAFHAEGKPLDQVTFAEAHPKWAPEIWKLTDEVPALVTAVDYADIVKEASVRRRVHAAGVRIAEWSQVRELSALTEDARKELDEAFGMTEQRVRFMDETLLHTLDRLTNEDPVVFPTPWGSLNSVLNGGVRPGQLVIIAARPSLGKSAVALQIATELAKTGSVAYVSLEMSEEDLQLRAVSQGATVPLSALTKNAKQMPEWMWQKVARWREQTRMPISFDDRSELTVADIRTFARSVHRKAPLAGIVVDYLQLITDRRKGDISREQQVSYAVRQLKIMARTMGVPVIALSQLNRQSESRADRRPQISDLRESGAIEQDADTIILLHRDMKPGAVADDFEMLVAKNRNGELALVRLAWEGEFVRVTPRRRRVDEGPGQPPALEGV
ncbi:DnaB-like helicase C-terminal domain-containing protein [Herbiconiux sp. KACC 21604]|uniref:replicative DNA helicase n=1 Tax=unclassified Herbiconiux TaxID=2618217 RepID=UPI001491507A|nr:DnaB-like helicase C-terminal domain-containing protein [Herbiconiux sp. SALV-R1]QJU52949.1 AAA family ATPase [Herbiconiux sp. SALV-R1]WPO87871.1 DnaB-like helicase C-terminal domain-containing protein [Herbiconiux sp. KACC 21604]